MADGVPMTIFIPMMVIFIAVTVILGLLGFRHTKENKHFLLGRNKANSFLIGISYGATFLSTSAIIGFGGQAATHGLTMIWLVFLNLFLGLMVPFIFFAPRVRRIGRKVNASTFADLLGKIFKSKGIRAFTAFLIIVMMPIYAAAVLKGGVNAVVVITGLTEYYNLVLIVIAVVVGLYVIFGGVLAVMYNDVLQASMMLVGMLIIFGVTIFALDGGLTGGLETLDGLKDVAGQPGTLEGTTGFASLPKFLSKEFWLVVSTFILGVGIGAMTQPQLVVRFLSAKDDKMLSRSMIVGSIFTLVIVGIAYTVGALTNVYFWQEHSMTSFQYISSLKLGVDFIIPQYVLEVFSNGGWGNFFICAFILSLLCAAISTLSALMHAIGAAGGHDVYTVVKTRNVKYKAGAAFDRMSNSMTKKFIKSTDDEQTITDKKKDYKSLRINRTVTFFMMILVVVYTFLMPNDIIAKATSLFMGMTAAALLPLLIYGLYSKRPKKQVVIPSIIVGTITYLFWALFINSGSSIFLPICKWITGQQVLFMEGTLRFVDSLVIALPLSVLTMVIMLIVTKNKYNEPVAEEAAAESKPEEKADS